MELKDPFGIAGRFLGRDTAQGIWERCNGLLSGGRPCGGTDCGFNEAGSNPGGERPILTRWRRIYRTCSGSVITAMIRMYWDRASRARVDSQS